MGLFKRTYKKNGSLKRVVVSAALIGALIFLCIITNIEALLIYFPTMSAYKREIEHGGRYVMNLMEEPYLVEYIQTVKEVYESTPEEIRQDEFSDEYKEVLVNLLDKKFWQKRELLSRYRENAGMSATMIAFLDEQNERLVVVIDGSELDGAFMPGQWISNEIGEIDSARKIRKTLESEWYMPISYGTLTGWTATDYIGIYDEAGNLAGYFTVNVRIEDLGAQIRRFLLIFFPIVAILVGVSLFISSKFMSKRFLGPILALENAAKKVSSAENMEAYESKRFFKELNITTGDEFEHLWETMVRMEDDVVAAIAKIREQATEKQRIETELDVAKNIQLSAIPNDFPAFPDRKDFDIYASMTPAKEVGGDFYDFFLIDDNHLGLVIADVSDKGVPAALFMMMSKTLLRARAMEGGKPSSILAYTNKGLCKNNDNMMFVTIWFGILELSTGKITAANAGHEFPFYTDENGEYKLLKDVHGIMCGAFEEFEYEDYEFVLPKGGKLFVYTDGVPEAHNSNDEMLGLDETLAILNRYKSLDPMQTIKKVHEEIDSYAGDGNQFDDITMLCLEYRGQ